MAESFKRDTPVMDFSPYRPATHSRYAERRFILWPAYSYRIVAPRPRNRPLNLLQRAVLNLCRAGVRELEEMGKKLAIHRAVLIGRKHVDIAGPVWAKGRTVAAGDTPLFKPRAWCRRLALPAFDDLGRTGLGTDPALFAAVLMQNELRHVDSL